MSRDAWSWGVARSSRPILVGPWRSEVGFEVLYWLPYLEAWLAQMDRATVRRQIAWRRWRCQGLTAANLTELEQQARAALCERLVILTRGGAGAWYPEGSRAVDLYDYASLAEYRVATLADQQATGSVKQTTVTPWDRALLRMVEVRHGLRGAHLLHPSQMYRHLSPWWETSVMGLSQVVSRLRFAPFRVPTVPVSVTATLPPRFTVARFYGRHTWPVTEETRDWMTALVGAVAAQTPVVVLGSAELIDDHLSVGFDGPNITNLIGAFPARESLAIESAIVARASGFIGTYGGIQQLAVRLRVPSVGMYGRFAGTSIAHKVLTEWLAVQQQTACWIGRPQDLAAVCGLAGAVLPFPIPTRVGGSSS